MRKLYIRCIFWNHIQGREKALEISRTKLLGDLATRVRLQAREKQQNEDASSTSSEEEEEDGEDNAEKKKTKKQIEVR